MIIEDEETRHYRARRGLRRVGGSQLAAYVYGTDAVIWVVGSQKIVPDRDAAFQRIYEYSYPREDERAREAYGFGSGVNKVLVVNREFMPGRITVILVKQELGF